MATALEQSIHDICAKHGFHAVSFGINLQCVPEHHFSANVHWVGFSRDGNPCESGMGASIIEALTDAINRANANRAPSPGIPADFGDEELDEQVAA